MSIRVLIVLCAVVIAAAVWAQGPGGGGRAANYNNLIGGSDIIVLGGVDTATIPDVPAAPAGGGGGAAMTPQTGQAKITLKVTKVMSGTLDAASVDLTVPLTVMRTGRGATATRAWAPDVSVGKQLIVGLVKTQAGLAVTPGTGTVISAVAATATAADPATAVATALTNFAYSATIAAPADPLTVDGQATFTITVKNTGTTAMNIGGVVVNVIQDGAATGAALTFTPVSDTAKNADGTPQSLAAGASATITAVVNVVGPTGWAKLDPKVFPMAATVAAVVNIVPVRAAGGGGGGGGAAAAMRGAFGVKSPWVAVKLVGPKVGV